VVISDRFDLSTEAYQIGGRGLPADLVRVMNQAATGGLRPDLTLLLDLPLDAAEARQRESGKSRDRLESESRAFHDRVVAYYRRVETPGICRIDATLPREQVLEQAWEVLHEGHTGIFLP
jgi:dTMP kinase